MAKPRPTHLVVFVSLLATVGIFITVSNVNRSNYYRGHSSGGGATVVSVEDLDNLRVLDRNDLAELCNCRANETAKDAEKEKKAIEYRSGMPEHFKFKDAHYTFTEAAKYEGPVVKGWPPQKSRNMNLYIKPQKNTILTGKLDLYLYF